MSSIGEVYNLLPDGGLICFVIPSLLNKNECEKLLNTERRNSFQKAISNYPTYYRNNDRFVSDDSELSDFLFQKVKPYLPNRIEIRSSTPSENGTWTLTELNRRLRFCKYVANQYFHRHLDGVHHESRTKQSKLTFMIYLNGATEFEGGRTLFYRSREAIEVWAAYVPQQGDLMVFDHNLWHEGEEVKGGEKFVLRSDIIYTKEIDEHVVKPFNAHLGYVWKLLMFDEETLLSAGRDKVIHVWDLNGKLIQSLTGHDNSILWLEKLNETTFVSASRDQQIKVWRRNDNRVVELVNSFTVHSAVVLCLCRLTDDLFASSGGDNAIKIVDLAGHIKQDLREHTNWVWQVVNLPNSHIASCSEDGTIRIWDYTRPVVVNTFTDGCAVICLLYDGVQGTLISGNIRGEIVLRRLSEHFDETMLRRIVAHDGIVRTILKLDEGRIASGGEDSKVKIWDVEGQQCVTELEHQNFVQSLEITSDNRLVSASYDGTIKVWDI